MKDIYYKHIVLQQPTVESIQAALDKEEYFSLVDIVSYEGFIVVLVLKND